MIAVTGASGLVGSHLVLKLLGNGEKLRILKREKSDFTYLINQAKKNNLNLNLIEWYIGDVLDYIDVENLIIDCDKIFHCAALISFQSNEAGLMYATNCTGTENIVNACLATPNKIYLLHVSSVATLGREAGAGILNENSQWVAGKHNSNYAISKYGAEREVWRGIAEGLNACIINPSIIIGESHLKTGSAGLFYHVFKQNLFYTKGSSGFVDVLDVVDAIMFLADKKLIGERYILNVESIKYKTLFDSIAKFTGVKSPSINVPKFFTSFTWRIAYLHSLFTGKQAFITRESAYASMQDRAYSSDKIKALGFKFRDVNESIERVSKFFNSK